MVNDCNRDFSSSDKGMPLRADVGGDRNTAAV
jgi:hypothetical protein